MQLIGAHSAWLSHPIPQRVAALTAVSALGALLSLYSSAARRPLIALAFAVALVGGALIILDTHWGFVALAGVVFVLPLQACPSASGSSRPSSM